MFVYPSATGAFPPGNRDRVLVSYSCRLEFDEESFPGQRTNVLAKGQLFGMKTLPVRVTLVYPRSEAAHTIEQSFP